MSLENACGLLYDKYGLQTYSHSYKYFFPDALKE